MIKILSWGTELELGDVGKNIDIPHYLGSWEHFESDIVNQRFPYWGIAVDPKGINPPVGGEINTFPTKTWEEQIDIISKIEQFFRDRGYEPTTSCVSNTHIHVRIKDLCKNIDLLKRFILAVLVNQKRFVESVYHFELDPRMSEYAIHYLRDDSGLLNDETQLKRMLYAKDINEIFNLIRGNVSTIKEKSKRCAINFKPLLFMETIEFRCFRATLNKEELSSCFKICERFIETCINNIKFDYILQEHNYVFPYLKYDHKLFESWVNTKHHSTFKNIKSHKLVDI